MVTIKIPNSLSVLITELADSLLSIFAPLNCVVEKVEENIEFAYNPVRKQYDAEKVLIRLKRITQTEFRVLGIVLVDLYVQGLNFVFGLAECPGKAALISLYRLRPEFYGEPRDKRILFERMMKEAVHELGHTFALKHCPEKSCVMHFSNSILDIDVKEKEFCPLCKEKLKRTLKKHKMKLI